METQLYDYVMGCFAASDQTYREIAEGSGVSQRTIEKIARKEVADPSVSNVQKLANYFRSHRAAA